MERQEQKYSTLDRACNFQFHQGNSEMTKTSREVRIYLRINKQLTVVTL